MPNVTDMFPSRWVSAADLNGRPRIVVIDRVVQEMVADEAKWVCYFRGATKGLVLNRTNSTAIAAALGPDTAAWIAQRLELYPTMVDFRGKQVAAVRVRRAAQAVAVAAPPEPVAPHDLPDDEVPF